MKTRDTAADMPFWYRNEDGIPVVDLEMLGCAGPVQIARLSPPLRNLMRKSRLLEHARCARRPLGA